MPSAAQTLEAVRFEELRDVVEAELQNLDFPDEPADLYDAVRYVLKGGGKRLRPVTLLLTAEAFGVETERAMPAALAVELFHNFTLVHDDIMDKAETRRNRRTVHIVWNAETAILAGDLIMAKAYDTLSKLSVTNLADVHHRFYRTVAALCEGQSLDTAFERRSNVSVDAYLDMIDRKTGALLQSCFELGGVLGDAASPKIQELRELGRHVGRGFQIQDDLLDLMADDARWGKVIGGDLMVGKKTYLLLRSLELSEGRDYEWFQRIVTNEGLRANQVDEARERMSNLGVLTDAEEAVRHHVEQAVAHLDVLPEGNARATLHWLLLKLQKRVH